MINPFQLPSEERLTAWREFREAITTLSPVSQLDEVARFWSQCPFSNHTLHPEDSQNWPTVWEMLDDGEYCRNAIAVAMETTLRLIGWKDKTKLVMIRDQDGEEYFTVVANENKALNYNHGEVTLLEDLSKETTIKYCYRWTGQSYSKD